VSGGGYPVLVDQSATAAVGAGESEEGGAPHRHLPGPTTEGRALTAHDPRLGTRHRGGMVLARVAAFPIGSPAL